MKPSPRFLAITPPTGFIDPGHVERWREAGLLEHDLWVLLRDEAADASGKLFNPRWTEFQKACDHQGLRMVVAVKSEQVDDVIAARGGHLKGGWQSLQSTLAPLIGKHPDALWGLSCHAEDPPSSELDDGLSYKTFAPVFPPFSGSPEKTALATGPDALRSFCSASPTPVLALGGMTPERATHCLAAGAHGIAAIRAFFGAEARLSDYVRALERHAARVPQKEP